jgi:hypothetical protein
MRKKINQQGKLTNKNFTTTRSYAHYCETYDDECLRFLENMSYLDGLDVAI